MLHALWWCLFDESMVTHDDEYRTMVTGFILTSYSMITHNDHPQKKKKKHDAPDAHLMIRDGVALTR